MEKVFWLMWLADIAGSIGVIGVTSLIALGLTVLCLVLVSAAQEDGDIFLRGVKAARWLLIPVAIASLMPSSKTIHILAVASAADAAASTQLGAKSIEALNAVLDKVIDKAKKD